MIARFRVLLVANQLAAHGIDRIGGQALNVEAIEDDPTGAFYKVLQLRYRGTVGEVSDRAYRVVVTIRPTGFKVR